MADPQATYAVQTRIEGDAHVSLRPTPYPYRAMLAICSDLDETPSKGAYLEAMRFLNTNEPTAMGDGVGLEVANSIYFNMPAGQFAYWNTDEAGREMIRMLIRSGHVDCLHSYGELAFARADAARALDELAKHDCQLAVWVDHSTAATNLGADIMQGYGDIRGHEAYHADLTIAHGIEFVWRGRVTSIIGQDIPRKLGGLFTSRHPFASGRTLCKEWAKGLYANNELGKYAMHGANEILRKDRLRDGAEIYEFMRCNPHWGGVSSGEKARDIGDVLTDDMLAKLVRRQGACILYTHLGKIDGSRVPFNRPAVAALRRLAEAQRRRKILVTTTRRLLGFKKALREVSYEVEHHDDVVCISVKANKWGSRLSRLSSSDLDGLTFYVQDPQRACLTVNGREISKLQRNGPDHTGRASVSLPWPALEFPNP